MMRKDSGSFYRRFQQWHMQACWPVSLKVRQEMPMITENGIGGMYRWGSPALKRQAGWFSRYALLGLILRFARIHFRN